MAKKPSVVRSPVRNSLSLSSISLVIRFAPRASVRAIKTVGTPITSAAKREAVRVRICFWVGIKTLPPMWPHFFSEESWSSKWTPAAPASIMLLVSSNTFNAPPKPASASATMGAIHSRVASPLFSVHSIWSARLRALLILSTTEGTELTGYKL